MKIIDRTLLALIGLLMGLTVYKDSKREKRSKDCVTVYAPGQLADGTPLMVPVDICKPEASKASDEVSTMEPKKNWEKT